MNRVDSLISELTKDPTRLVETAQTFMTSNVPVEDGGEAQVKWSAQVDIKSWGVKIGAIEVHDVNASFGITRRTLAAGQGWTKIPDSGTVNSTQDDYSVKVQIALSEEASFAPSSVQIDHKSRTITVIF